MPESLTQSPKPRPHIGKDELNLADWRISAPTHQQPRKDDGGKVDVIEYEMPKPDGTTQKVTIMAPSIVGLPTPADEDLLLALLALGKEQQFTGDIVRFSTTDLCHALHRSPNQAMRDRIEEGLTRLKAVTLKYELAWYDRLKANVEPILITGILAEAKLMRRRGRPRNDEPNDSYVQWTNNFFQTIRSGNLTDIDLDLYFSFTRPGTKQLYRHLNKRFHGRRGGDRYERDLTHLACGHLGMTRSKYLKRNLDLCIRELEQRGYIVREDPATRYRKIRSSVWRVGFELAPEFRRTPRAKGVPASSARSSRSSVASNHVARFHELWSGVGDYRPGHKELAIAQRLIATHGVETLEDALPRIVKILKEKWPDCRTFKGVESYIDEALSARRENEQRRQERLRREKQQREEKNHSRQRRQQRDELERYWNELSPAKQKDIRATALRGHPADVLTRRPALALKLCLAELRKHLRDDSIPKHGSL